MFPWLKLFYDNYKMEIADEDIVEKILTKFEPSKNNPRLYSQYYIYFLYAVYAEKAEYYYLKFNLGTRMNFYDCGQSYVHQQYPQTKILVNFYLNLNLFDMANYPESYNSTT